MPNLLARNFSYFSYGLLSTYDLMDLFKVFVFFFKYFLLIYYICFQILNQPFSLVFEKKTNLCPIDLQLLILICTSLLLQLLIILTLRYKVCCTFTLFVALFLDALKSRHFPLHLAFHRQYLPKELHKIT